MATWSRGHVVRSCSCSCSWSPRYATRYAADKSKKADGTPYGTAVDLWSLGVVLFATVAGYLPFHAHNNNKQELCHKIMRGSYSAPDFMSQDLRELVASILKVDPDKRATIAHIHQSRWLRSHHAAGACTRAQNTAPTTYPVIMTDSDIDQGRLQSLEGAGLNKQQLAEYLRRSEHNYWTAAYHLLAYRDSSAKGIGMRPESAAPASTSHAQQNGVDHNRVSPGSQANGGEGHHRAVRPGSAPAHRAHRPGSAPAHRSPGGAGGGTISRGFAYAN